jgi:hypothetical protein
VRQRLTIILTILVVLGVLVILNAVTYVREEKAQDSELAANRSTYHSGPTGSRALYDFLSESGHKVMRWREVPEKLLGDSGQKVQTFVVIGRTQLPFSEEQANSLLLWVERGGRLVLIDRRPEHLLLPKSENWTISAEEINFPGTNVDPSNTKEMTENIEALQPVQATPFTRDVQAVMPSRFASPINISFGKEKKGEQQTAEHGRGNFPKPNKESPPPEAAKLASPAPVVHVAGDRKALLVDYSYGLGRIVVLSDPYVVSNGGIGLKDNLQLAINMLASTDGLIAFDEYHQGRGSTQNAFASYFSGTPVLAIGGQIILLVLVLLWTRARRFARPLPLVQTDRRSSLEFVASMAELQERSRAFDLAIENIYSRTRRVLARHAGVDYNSPRSEIARRVASRSAVDARWLETLMRQCEEVINGQPTNWRQSIDLVRRLRETEGILGLRMRSRDARQAADFGKNI